jgi:peptidoglycan-N-acetylglucosamine deacetylase
MRSSALTLLGAGSAVAAMAWAVRGRSSRVFGPSVWHGPPGRKAIALTFDDGPSPSTPAILDILASYRIPATFFQCGVNVLRLPALSRVVREAGHEIGNHSHTHPNFALKSASFIQDDFARAQTAISEAITEPPTLMRPPFGVRWFGFREMQARLKLRSVMWTVIGRDWKLGAPAIAERVLAGACDGAIVCLHDGRGTLETPDINATIEAVRRIVPALIEKGYHFETVSQLTCPMI